MDPRHPRKPKYNTLEPLGSNGTWAEDEELPAHVNTIPAHSNRSYPHHHPIAQFFGASPSRPSTCSSQGCMYDRSET
ncbi:hypothetical protein TNCV_2103321 [Trichonephila clavipes]|nr:hypothetical protein TNCV_2103321 [Trichonephila clavipes]